MWCYHYLKVVAETLMHLIPSFSNIFWVGISMDETRTLFGSSMRTFIESHLEPIHNGRTSGFTGSGASTICTAELSRSTYIPYDHGCYKYYLPSSLLKHTKLVARSCWIDYDQAWSYWGEGCIDVHWMLIIKTENVNIVLFSKMAFHPLYSKNVCYLESRWR